MDTQKRQITLGCTVDQYRSGWTVVEFLAHRFKYHTEEGWRRRVIDRAVKVNAAAIDPDHVVAADDAVEYTIWHAEPPVDFCYDVLYEDEHLMAVSKSGNIPVHACGVYITHTLIGRLKVDFPDTPDLNLAHRLDRETSGVVILTKTRFAARELAQQFREGEVKKRYQALVYGEIPVNRFEVNAPIAKVDQRYQYPDDYEYGKANDLASYLPKRKVDFAAGKPATTEFIVERRSRDYTVLRAVPLTGRTNQIRVHAAWAGYPVVGDKVYALEGEIRDELLRKGVTDRVRAALVLDRHALHCGAMSISHPLTRERLTIAAPLPEDLHPLIR